MGVVLDGLMEALVFEGHFEFAYVEILDRQWGMVGMGFVSPDPDVESLAPANRLGSVLETLRIEGKR